MATCFTSVPVRSLIVMLSAVLAHSLELDALDTVEILGDVAGGTGEQRPGAVGRDVDVLSGIGAAEVERVEAVTALDHVAAVARIPDERVVAVAEERRVSCLYRR